MPCSSESCPVILFFFGRTQPNHTRKKKRDYVPLLATCMLASKHLPQALSGAVRGKWRKSGSSTQCGHKVGYVLGVPAACVAEHASP